MKERMAGVRVVQALGVGIAAGGGAEWKQARTIAAVAADRQPSPHDHSETVTQRVQALDSGDVVHQAEGIAVGIQLTAIQSRPCHHADSASQRSKRP